MELHANLALAAFSGVTFARLAAGMTFARSASGMSVTRAAAAPTPHRARNDTFFEFGQLELSHRQSFL